MPPVAYLCSNVVERIFNFEVMDWSVATAIVFPFDGAWS